MIIRLHILSRFRRNTSGAVALEFSLVMLLCIALTLGALDGAFAYFQWLRTDKGLQEGIRMAVVSDYVLTDLGSFDCYNATSADYGQSCAGSTVKIPTANCISDGSAVSCSCVASCSAAVSMGNVSQAAFDAIVARIQVYNPDLQATNLSISYADVGLGFAGRPGGAVPAVTLSIRNFPYDFFVLNNLFQLPQINMPAMTTTLTGEDQASG
ncbi:TadE/TadG family type IV pilus assembly protein [uncultured Sneathiella sp.]|jgi:Flp pilus assembly protein TadG|uniref:TadE/TadG family type IV pilus assembly protein n=1 Tax=uncultured Sneathiella sp. TaxID=879315 RepID=UPI00259618AB|nr:TadE/TadG family type IV pilus assembly protein [uncultured Sneathiella sp.]